MLECYDLQQSYKFVKVSLNEICVTSYLQQYYSTTDTPNAVLVGLNYIATAVACGGVGLVLYCSHFVCYINCLRIMKDLLVVNHYCIS